jgi:hypothetical protein
MERGLSDMWLALPYPGRRIRGARARGKRRRMTAAQPPPLPAARGLQSFRFSSTCSVLSTGSANLCYKCVLELLKLSSKVNECKPLPPASCRESRWRRSYWGRRRQRRRWRTC